MDVLAGFGDIGRRVVDTVLPLRCLACGAIVDEIGALCPACWTGLELIAAPVCASCGLPFGHDGEPGAVCGGCLAHPPAFDRARAALRYNDLAAKLIVGFKRGDRLHHLAAFARWLERSGGSMVGEADLICPVPLHPVRLWRRRYNQSALLANALAKRAARRSTPDLLVRRRATPSQGGLNRRQRIENLRGAIAVRRGRTDAVRGARVVVVDDVMTTGATVDACAKALKRAGALRVDVVALARVVRGTT